MALSKPYHVLRQELEELQAERERIRGELIELPLEARRRRGQLAARHSLVAARIRMREQQLAGAPQPVDNPVDNPLARTG